uniref:Coatomer subunit zeta n=1 Tax=Moschus moschiferus TaxID=68415 RepID=A0A8C6D2Z5_MOSMO
MEALILEPSLYTVKAILILDNDGDLLFAKYYDDTYPSVKEQKAFEKNIFKKTHRTDSEIALLEGLTVVYKSSIDLYFYVIGSSYENELMLMTVLNCLFDSLSQMLRKNVEKRALLENMEGLFLAVDETVDGGVILKSDPQRVVHRVALRGEDVPLTEQTVSQPHIQAVGLGTSLPLVTERGTFFRKPWGFGFPQEDRGRNSHCFVSSLRRPKTSHKKRLKKSS